MTYVSCFLSYFTVLPFKFRGCICIFGINYFFFFFSTGGCLEFCGRRCEYKRDGIKFPLLYLIIHIVFTSPIIFSIKGRDYRFQQNSLASPAKFIIIYSSLASQQNMQKKTTNTMKNIFPNKIHNYIKRDSI